MYEQDVWVAGHHTLCNTGQAGGCCGGAVVVTVPGDCGGDVATWALGLGCQVLPTQSLLLRGEHWLDIPSNKAPGAAVLTIFSGYPLPPCPS